MNTLTWDRFTHAPLVLLAYLAFAVTVTLVGVFAIGPVWFPAAVAYTGMIMWMPYLFTLHTAVWATASNERKYVYRIVPMLIFGMAIGTVDEIWHTFSPRPIGGHPLSAYHPFRPVITIGLPAIWCLLLISPGMRKWINDAPRDMTNKRTESESSVVSARPSP